MSPATPWPSPPGQDDLVVSARAPYNVACWLIGRDERPSIGLPGLRVEASYEEGWRLRHLPTGATMTITGDRHGRLRGRPDPDSNWMGLWGTDVPVNEEEYATLEALPRVSEEAETLLAALTVRLCTKDPTGGWDLGMWFYDLSERPARGSTHRRRCLSAEGDECELHWDCTPYPEDLRAALTHPVVGLSPEQRASRRSQAGSCGTGVPHSLHTRTPTSPDPWARNQKVGVPSCSGTHRSRRGGASADAGHEVRTPPRATP